MSNAWKKIVLVVTMMVRAAHAVALSVRRNDWDVEDLKRLDTEMKESNLQLEKAVHLREISDGEDVDDDEEGETEKLEDTAGDEADDG